MSNLLADLQAKAQRAEKAVEAQVKVERHGAFRDHSDATEPSADWVSPRTPEGIALYGFQDAAVETAYKYRKALIGFAPGMGKTPTALTALANEVYQGRSCNVVVVPPALRLMWAAEAERFFPDLTVTVVTGTKPADIEHADIIVVGDSTVAPRLDDLLALPLSSLVIDEAHRIKNLAAKRTKAVLTLADALDPEAMVMGLTGTLAVNRPDEIYPPIRMLGAHIARAVSGGSTATSFKQRWCILEAINVRGRTVNKVVGCMDAEALHEALRTHCYVRVEREDVLDMPSKVWSHQTLMVNGARAEYDRAERDFIAWLLNEKGGADDPNARAAAERARRSEAITKLNAMWKLAGRAKASGVAPDYILDLVDQGEQVVVMSHHREVSEALAEALDKADIPHATILGGQTPQSKRDAEEAFRAGDVDVLVCSIQAAKEGLNLEAAAHLVFTQLPWSPGDLQQSSDRIYRVTQNRDCTIHVLGLDNSVDEKMWLVLNAKAKVVDAINAGQQVTIPDEEVYEAVMNSYR